MWVSGLAKPSCLHFNIDAPKLLCINGCSRGLINGNSAPMVSLPTCTPASSEASQVAFNRGPSWVTAQQTSAKKRVSSVLTATAKELSIQPDNVESEAAADANEGPKTDPKEAAKATRRAEDWEKALKAQESGALQYVKVEACNNGGLLVRYGSVAGFLPFSQVCTTRSPKDGKTMVDVGQDMIGQTVMVKVIEANKDDRRLIFSEKQAVWSESIGKIKEGDVFEGKVNSVTDFGAFVDLRFPDGSYRVTGLVHISELSWDHVYDPKDIVQEGQDVQVKVTNMDIEKMRIGLSIKQLQVDPLLETLDTVMSQEESPDNAVAYEDGVSNEPLPGLADICQELLSEDGIIEVNPGRVAIEKRVVSQDLELWISSAPVEEGSFTILARAGRQVQEVHVKTTLDRDGLKIAVQRVTERVP